MKAPQKNRAPALLVILLVFAGVWYFLYLKETARRDEAYKSSTLSQLGEFQKRLAEFKARQVLRSIEHQTELIGADRIVAIGLEAKFTRETITAASEDLAPIGRDFFALEKAIKEKHNGSLPQWVKDDRNWRALDKEFQR